MERYQPKWKPLIASSNNLTVLNQWNIAIIYRDWEPGTMKINTFQNVNIFILNHRTGSFPTFFFSVRYQLGIQGGFGIH